MYTKITLTSGNVFYHKPENSDEFSSAFIIDKNLNFIGGFLSDEADRKLKVFSKLSNVIVEKTITLIDMKYVNFESFANKLGTASKLLLDNWNLMISDYQDCNGTSSKAESCDDRSRYYKAVGCPKLFKSSKKFPLWAFVANHVSIFSVKDFRETFFKGYEERPEKDINLNESTRYSKEGFKAPAAYIRALCLNK